MSRHYAAIDDDLETCRAARDLVTKFEQDFAKLAQALYRPEFASECHDLMGDLMGDTFGCLEADLLGEKGNLK